MRHTYIILIFGIYANTFFGQVNSAEIIYKVKFERKKMDTTSLQSKKVYSVFDKVYQELDFIEIKLIFYKNKSSFEVIEFMEIDDKRRFFRNKSKGLADLNSNFYHDINQNIRIREKEYDGKKYNITSPFDNIDWIVTQESKRINNLICFKALSTKSFRSKGKTVNLKVEAWFTPDISIPVGPKNYTNLPGLIIELREGRKTYYATKIRINPKDKLKIINPKKGIVITEKEYAKMTEGTYNKFINSIK